MKKAILAIAAATALAAGTLTVPTTANARCYGCAVGAGILGGLIIGSAIASHPGYYAYEYDGPPPRECDGYWARRRLYDRYGNFVGWSRPRWFCRY